MTITSLITYSLVDEILEWKLDYRITKFSNQYGIDKPVPRYKYLNLNDN